MTVIRHESARRKYKHTSHSKPPIMNTNSKHKKTKTQKEKKPLKDTRTLKMLDFRDKPKRFPRNPAGPQFYSLDRV